MHTLPDLSPVAYPTAHIFIVDCCPYFIDGLVHTLTDAGYAIAGHAAAHDALDTHVARLKSSHPLACIIGPNPRTCHAFDACHWLRANVDHAAVVFISQHADDAIFKVDAAYSGALACLPVDTPPEALLSALPRVLAGQSLIPPEFQDLQVESLTEREMDVLRLLAEGKTVPEIATTLYLGKGTTDKRKQNVFRKMRVHRKEDAIHRARHLGWLPCD